METKERERLIEAGIDVDGGITRCMGNEALYKKLIKRIWEDTNYQEILSGLKEENMETVLRAAHTLKGISGNLGFIRLYNITEEIVKMIREGREGEVEAKTEELTQSYEEVLRALEETGNR